MITRERLDMIVGFWTILATLVVTFSYGPNAWVTLGCIVMLVAVERHGGSLLPLYRLICNATIASGGATLAGIVLATHGTP